MNTHMVLEHNLKKTSLSTDEKARIILASNDKGGYTVPTSGMYPYQWNWDSAFVALGFATYNLNRAIVELETLFDGQWDNGMVPHIVFRVHKPTYFPGPPVWRTQQDPESSGITQPPVAGSILWSLFQKCETGEQKQRIKTLFPKILESHRWFHTYRDPNRIGIVTLTHPWESGRDNSPEWDAAMANVDVSDVEYYERRDLDHADADMRPTKAQYDVFVRLIQFGRDCGWDADHIGKNNPLRVADIGMTMMLLRANRDMKKLALALGCEDEEKEISSYIERGILGAQSLWDDNAGAYCSRDLITDKSSGYVTSASFLAFYAGVGAQSQRARLLEHFDRIAGAVQFMMPSFDPEQELFDSKRYWRGPVWAVVNYMIATGLGETGHSSRALRVQSDTRTLIDENGFQEAFDPITGAGTGGSFFSWTAAMWLAWAKLKLWEES